MLVTYITHKGNKCRLRVNLERGANILSSLILNRNTITRVEIIE